MTDFEMEKLLARWTEGETLSTAEIAALKGAFEQNPEFLDAAADPGAVKGFVTL